MGPKGHRAGRRHDAGGHLHTSGTVAALLALILVGCVGPAEPPTPAGDPGEWNPDAEAWLVRTTGCGFCGPATGQPVHEMIAYDQAGGILWARYARAESGTQTAVANATLAEYQPTLARLFGSVAAYAVEDGQGVVVHEVAVGRLSKSDEQVVDAYLETALRNTVAPGPPDFTGCADCPAVTLDALSGANRVSVVLNMVQDHQGDAWRRIDDQLLTLSQWVQGTVKDPRAGTGGPVPADTVEEALSEAWIVRSTGCGLCSGDPETPEFELVLVEYGGGVVNIAYARDASFTVARGVKADAGALRALFERVDAYGKEGERGVRVHSVDFAVLGAAEFDRIRTDLEATLATVQDPGPTDSTDCADCAAVHLDIFDESTMQWQVRLLGNTAKGDPWLAVDRSLSGLGTWLAERS